MCISNLKKRLILPYRNCDKEEGDMGKKIIHKIIYFVPVRNETLLLMKYDSDQSSAELVSKRHRFYPFDLSLDLRYII